MGFRISLEIFTKNLAEIFIGIRLNLHQFVQNLHVNNTVSSNIYTQYISIFLWDFIFCQHCFYSFYCTGLLHLVTFIPLYFIFLMLFSNFNFNCLLIVHINTINLYIMILYPVNLQNLFLSSTTFSCRFCRIFCTDDHVICE